MIDLALVKTHLKVDGDEEDTLVQGYVDAAISTFELWTNRKLIAEGDQLPDPVGNALVITKAISQGALLLVGHWYANRETVAIGTIATELPMATNALWLPHRWVNV
ncbi:head-tail connector protein [Pseudomonas asiatica]|uniref:head-tail connector protein n=1 Tax=Pseudomonas asiatica TaxID=2219225 RepID=UPI000EEB9EE5|nr:phage gp6-like head-tail connector protein [Pseudomonas putida]HDS0930609.1 phage gp6-like head-tail connector protein [Pseudomonas putida]